MGYYDPMRIKDLIDSLRAIMEEHGNIDVFTGDGNRLRDLAIYPWIAAKDPKNPIKSIHI